MTTLAAERPVGRPYDAPLGRVLGDPAARGLPRWQVVAAALAVGLSVAALWITLRADFLAHPQWLAVQKADFILGPAITGLYWMRRRPESRFGPMLLAFAFIGAVYLLQSSSDPWLFSVGLMWENVIGLATYVLILAFPTGRLDGVAAKVILTVAVLAVFVPAILILLVLPRVGAGGSISACLAACPRNELSVTSDPGLATDLFTWFRWAVIAVGAAIAVLLVWRLATGTRPQRRALAIGTPVALLFLAFQITFQLLGIAGVTAGGGYGVVVWGIVAARAALWYGFLLALVAAELFAGRALRRMVVGSLRRPPPDELEAMLREPLGDPRLELRFADPRTGAFPGGAPAGGSAPSSGRDVTVVESAGAPAVAILYDAQLNDDPELLEAAGAVALLASENAELDAAWADAVQELRRSRRRIVRAADDERRRLERNLHDGIQQQLVSLRIRLGLAGDRAGLDEPTRRELERFGDTVEATLDEVREIGQGLYPPVLTELGLAGALHRVRLHAPASVTFSAEGVGRYPADVESAVYYCAREAIQNAIKHGGPDVHVSVVLRQDDGELRAEVTDDGPGFDLKPSPGTGLQNMQDRIGAVGGRLHVVCVPSRGTTVSAVVPAHAA